MTAASMTEQGTTYVSLLTPPGRGALATIAVRGSNAWQQTQACLTEPIDDQILSNQSPRPWLRHFRGAGGSAASEELVVSFPNANEARLHCHGGTAACEAVLQVLEAQGAIRIGWQGVCARIALAEALTERTALILLDQLQGALQREISAIQQLLVQPETTAIAIARIDDLLARAPLGLHLTQPWRVVIAGRPNAGKSSLLNALLGYQRSITNEQPGTTRDVVTARTAFEGWPVELRDTAGLRSSNDALEVAGVELAESEIRSADLVLFVVPVNESLPNERQPERTMFVRSKCDLAPSTEAGANSTVGLPVSAITGSGLQELTAEVVRLLVPRVFAAGSGIPFTRELFDWLKQARQLLPDDPAAAVRLLSSGQEIEQGTL